MAFFSLFWKILKSTRLEVSRFFQIKKKVLVVQYSLAKIEVQVFAASQFLGGSKAKNLILCPVHFILRKQLLLFSDKHTLSNPFCFTVNNYKKNTKDGTATDVVGGRGCLGITYTGP